MAQIGTLRSSRGTILIGVPPTLFPGKVLSFTSIDIGTLRVDVCPDGRSAYVTAIVPAPADTDAGYVDPTKANITYTYLFRLLRSLF
jgi:hypothetical protein